MEHLTHHFWLTDDHSVLCKPCGATHKTSDADVLRFSMASSRAFMEKHRFCHVAPVARETVRVQIPYRIVPDPKREPS